MRRHWQLPGCPVLKKCKSLWTFLFIIIILQEKLPLMCTNWDHVNTWQQHASRGNLKERSTDVQGCSSWNSSYMYVFELKFVVFSKQLKWWHTDHQSLFFILVLNTVLVFICPPTNLLLKSRPPTECKDHFLHSSPCVSVCTCILNFYLRQTYFWLYTQHISLMGCQQPGSQLCLKCY